METTVVIILTFLVTIFSLIFIGAIGYIVWLFMNAPFNRLIRIKNWTAGKPYVEYVRAKVMKHDKLGYVYFMPQLKRENRQYCRYFGSEYEYTTNKSKKFYVPITYMNGVYAPEEYNAYETNEREVIEFNEKTNHFEKINKQVKSYIVQPLKQSMRQFNLDSDITIKEEYGKSSGFWEKYGVYVVSISMIGMVSVVCILLLIFAFQYAQDLNSAPAWVTNFLDAVTPNAAPPTTG